MRLQALPHFARSLPQTTWVNQWGGIVCNGDGAAFPIITLDVGTKTPPMLR
jgi:hypothetical protein